MSRTGAVMGLLGVAALVAAAAYATSTSDLDPAGPALNAAPPGQRVRVEVLNAGGVVGQARAATLQLRDLGFDVVHFGNADSFGQESTTVVDRVGRAELAHAVAGALGVETVVSDPDPNLFVDVTVLLGSEWSAGGAHDDADESSPAREPWDPRGWIGR
ncbi:MAG: LytR C-terminal domain-containing protein [Gemmatimonadota bacterium]